MATSAAPTPGLNVCLVGLGSIGISFAALHLRHGTGVVTVYDTRPDLVQHIEAVLPGYLDSSDGGLTVAHLRSQGRLVVASSLAQACGSADIVQEQGPENIEFKRNTWATIEGLVKPTAHLWTSTSGIAASVQNQSMMDRSRLLVVHPFNPPHILPLIEIVPSTETAPAEVGFARDFFAGLGSGHRPVVVNKELPGFVGNRLAYILFREAAYLVNEGVVSVQDADALIEASLGPRFAVQGPFKAYHMGGGTAGIRGFMANLTTTIQQVWDSYQDINLTRDAGLPAEWVEKLVDQVEMTYGPPTVEQFNARDTKLRHVIATQRQQ